MTGDGTLKTLERTFEIVEAIQELEGARVTELADFLDVAPSTVHAHLTTLEEHSYLVQEGDVYHVGLRFLHHGGHARCRKRAYHAVKEKVEALAEETGERVQFVVEQGGRGYYLFTANGERAVRSGGRVGRCITLHDSAAGKAILSRYPESRVRDIVDEWGLPKHTERTLTDEGAFLSELRETRERGFAVNRGETIEGLRAVGAPVAASDGSTLGAFSLSGPSERLSDERLQDELLHQLLGEINELELNLNHP